MKIIAKSAQQTINMLTNSAKKDVVESKNESNVMDHPERSKRKGETNGSNRGEKRKTDVSNEACSGSNERNEDDHQDIAPSCAMAHKNSHKISTETMEQCSTEERECTPPHLPPSF